MLSTDGILVKDYDGTLKILSDGVLKDAHAILDASEVSLHAPLPAVLPDQRLTLPRFSDLAPAPADPHFTEPRPQAAGDAVRELHFHPEDKDDAARELEKIQNFLGGVPQKKYSIEKVARKIAEKHSLVLTEFQFGIFIQVLLSFFRQMRNSVETRTALTRAVAEGGLGVSDAAVDHILAIAKSLKDKIEEIDGSIVEESKQSALQAVTVGSVAGSPTPSAVKQPASVSAAAPQYSASSPQGGVSQASVPLQPMAPTMAPPTPVTNPMLSPTPTPSAPSSAPARPQETAAQSAPSPEQQHIASDREASAIPRVTRPAPGGFNQIPIVEDVKRSDTRMRQPNLTGRVEELAGMTLALWRILDENPRIRAGKVLGKIQNLERESFTRKSQGVDAWRASGVYQLYLELGAQSLAQGKEVSQIIQDMTSRGETTLTLDEFEAISDLNRMLRF